MLFNKTHLWIAMLLCALILIGCKSFDYLTKIENTFPVAKTCGECHIDIYKEWSQSAHARAFLSPDFMAITQEGLFADCVACHTPEPQLTPEAPVARTILPEDGVTCTTCHLADGKMFGPVQPTGAVHPHPTEVAPNRFTEAAFCGRCHEGTYQQWQKTSVQPRQTCQQCHMPVVVRKVTQAKGGISKLIVSMEKQINLRKHTFMIYPQSADQEIFELHTAIEEKHVTVELLNLLPHSFPTGNFGVQIGVMLVQFMDADSHELQTHRYEFVQELKTNLPSGQSKIWTWDMPQSAAKMKIQLLRHGRSIEEQVELLNREVPLP
ncbi:MAG TPA: multiheme c-type cytochrome [Sedimentisphaerales bacterium]|nr:multiheme c-type cytochrome [Sedimentisphaerales bacterium]